MEFSTLGQHCSIPSCHQLDFLPFKCDYCSNLYCLQHRSIQSHQCTHTSDIGKTIPTCAICQQKIYIPANAEPDNIMNQHISSNCTTHLFNNIQEHVKQVKNNKLHCDYINTSTQIKCSNKNNYETLRCKLCHNQYCLTHRDIYSHQCTAQSKLRPSLSHNGITSAVTGAANGVISKGQALLEKIRQNKESRDNNVSLGIHSSRSSKSHTTSTNKNLSLQQLRQRMNAIGDNKLIESKRFYLDVTLPTTTIDGRVRASQPSIISYFNKSDTVGSIIEQLSTRYDIENRNSELNYKKLVLYSIRNKAALPFDVPLELLPPQVDQNDQVKLMYQ